MYSRKRKLHRAYSHSTQQMSMCLATPVRRSRREHCDGMPWLDVTEIAVGTGFRLKVEISMALSDSLIPGRSEVDGDYDQRMWDALCLSHLKLSLAQEAAVTFNFAFPRRQSEQDKLSEINLRLHAVSEDNLTRIGLLDDF